MAIEIGRKCYLCGEMAVARDLCGKHYKRWQKTGDPEKMLKPGWGSRRKHPLYDAWRTYGREGMSRCPEWDDFWKFVEDTGERPSPKHKLWRKDKIKPASPENIYWREPLPIESQSIIGKNAYLREHRKIAQPCHKQANLKKNDLIDLHEYSKLLDSQNGVCAICGNKDSYISPDGSNRSLAVDHCHDSMKVRGLLCTSCNRGLGFFRDNIKYLKGAIKYLKMFE